MKQMDAQAVLADMLRANADDPSWYPPFKEAVQDLSEAEALWKPGEQTHSIAELMRHLLYWNETWQIRYLEQNIGAVPPVANNASTFVMYGDIPLPELKQRLLDTLLKWQDLLPVHPLEAEAEGLGGAWWQVAGNVASHNTYHIGQIVLLRKLWGTTARLPGSR